MDLHAYTKLKEWHTRDGFVTLVGVLTLSVSSLVMLGWWWGLRPLLSILPAGPIMKFNTALLFFALGSALLSFRSARRPLRLAHHLAIVLIVAISLMNLVEYAFAVDLRIDNLFVTDIYSEVFPGRMAPATAICFFLSAAGFPLSHFENMRKFSRLIPMVVLSIALVALIAYALAIPASDKTMIWDSMAFHSALTFFWLSNAISLRCFPHGFASLLWGKLAGSQLLRSLVPVVVIFPLVLSYLLIELIAKRLIQYDFGIVFYTVTFILIGLYYVTLLAHYLNKNDQRRLELEQDLRSNNEKLSVFKQSMDATNIVSTTDTEGTLLEVNDNFCQISGYSRGELIGENYRILNSGYHPQSFFEGLWSTLKAGEVWVGEVCNKRKDGTLFWVYTTIVPLKNKAGEIEAFLSVRRDITRVKEDQALLASTYVKNLEQQNREMEQFVYIASHDLNEPLRTVKMMTDMIQADKPDSWNADAEQKFGFIREAVVRMLSLTQGLLDYSHLGRARHREQVDCNVLVEHVRQDLAVLLRDGGGSMEWEELPVIDGYPVELRLLFQNLIHNALKFARKDLPARVKISVAFEHGYWRFAVQDNGIGFPPEFRSRIFIIFQRLNPRAEYPGSGIGLAFCQKIVHLHGGEIWADSREGEGSTFYFTLAPKILKPTSLPK